MVVRVALAVVLALALLAASVPAIEDARADRTATRLDAAIGRLRGAVHSLPTSDAAVASGRGARRVVAVALPPRSLTTAGVARFAVVCKRVCAVEFRVRGSATVRRTLGSTSVRTPDGPVVLGAPGTHRLVLSLRRDGDERVVTVRRATATGDAGRARPEVQIPERGHGHR